jgi:hypothetical protein
MILQRHARRGDLDHRDLELGDLVADLVHHVGGLEAQQARHLDVDARLGDALLPHRLLADALAEGHARLQALDHLLQRHLGRADGAHAVVDAARPEAPLGDLEAAALAEQHVAGRHAHVLEHHLGVAVRRVVEAEHRQHAHDLHARRVERHQDLRLLRMTGRLGVGLAHDDGDLAARVADAGRPPLAAVDDVVVAVARIEVSMLVASDEATAGSVIRKAERISPFISGFSQRAFCSSCRNVQHFHVAGVGRRAVEDLDAEADAAHLLGADRVFEVGQAGAVYGPPVRHRLQRQEQVPQPGGLGLRLQRLLGTTCQRLVRPAAGRTPAPPGRHVRP